MNIWAALIAGGALTYLTRLSFIFLFGIIDPPEVLKRALRFVPPAVLSAIVFQELLIRDGAVFLSLGNTRLLAGLAAILVGVRSKNSLLVIATGMIVLLLLNQIAPG
ncbi:MAG: AzlD domain-containing protein [Chloroflexi bacterium]|nr:MAG: AzlD domain-containing protein [Chloroflexota bacterium]